MPILLQGASGTGKSYIAQLIYQYAYCTEKIKGKFMTINCAEYSNNPELFLTNVFGYKKGAYTGADKDQNGILYHKLYDFRFYTLPFPSPSSPTIISLMLQKESDAKALPPERRWI